MIEYRIIETPAEREEYQRLAGYCFTLPRGQTRRIFPLPEPESLAWGAFEEGALRAGIILRRFSAVLFGREFPAAGVAWVASAPEARNGGLIRRLMESALRHEYERGTVLSALYPFSFRFYGSFGFGSLGPRLIYRFAPGELLRAKVSGEFRPWDPTDEREYADMERLYRRRASGFDFAVTDLPPAALLARDIEAEGERFYLYRTHDNEPAAAISFRLEAAAGGTEMKVSRFLWHGSEGFRALCEFLRVHRGQCAVVELTLPSFVPLPFAAGEPRLSARIDQRWMARPLRIEPLLRARSACVGEGGEGAVDVDDPLFDENSGRYLCSGGEVRREPAAAAGGEGLAMSLFSSLLFGALSIEDLELLSGRERTGIGDLFRSKRRIWLTEEF